MKWKNLTYSLHVKKQVQNIIYNVVVSPEDISMTKKTTSTNQTDFGRRCYKGMYKHII